MFYTNASLYLFKVGPCKGHQKEVERRGQGPVEKTQLKAMLSSVEKTLIFYFDYFWHLCV